MMTWRFKFAMLIVVVLLFSTTIGGVMWQSGRAARAVAAAQAERDEVARTAAVAAQQQEADKQGAVQAEQVKQWVLQQRVEAADAEVVRLRKLGVRVVTETKVVTKEAPAVLPPAAEGGDDLMFKASWTQVSLAWDADPTKLWVKASANVNVRAVGKDGGADKWALDVPLELEPMLSTVAVAVVGADAPVSPVLPRVSKAKERWRLGTFVGCGVGVVGAANVWPAGQAGTFGVGPGAACVVGWGGVKARSRRVQVAE